MVAGMTRAAMHVAFDAVMAARAKRAELEALGWVCLEDPTSGLARVLYDAGVTVVHPTAIYSPVIRERPDQLWAPGAAALVARMLWQSSVASWLDLEALNVRDRYERRVGALIRKAARGEPVEEVLDSLGRLGGAGAVVDYVVSLDEEGNPGG